MLFKKKENHTEGSILRSLISLTISIILANIFQTAYQLIDTFWLGRLGANAVETADIILTDSDPNDVSAVIQLAKSTYKKMIQNLFWATGYNAFAIPLAARSSGHN